MRDQVSDKIVQRIKKLMALGLNSETPEAKSALNKAVALMQQYNVAEMDLNDDGHIKENLLVEEFVEVFSKTTDSWERILGTHIAKAFDSKMITIMQGRGQLPKRAFLGSKSDIALAIYFYKFIRMQIMRGAETQFPLVRDQKTYGYGCVMTVSKRLDTMYKKREKVMTSDSRALIVVKNEDVAKFYDNKYPGRKKGSKMNINGSSNAFYAGQADGEKIKMSQQISNKSATGAIMIGA